MKPVRLTISDLGLFYLAVAHVERVVRAFINHEDISWLYWALFALALWLVKICADAVSRE